MADRRRAVRTGRGYTIIELMVTLAVLGVVLGLAVPSFYGMIRDNRRTAVGNELVSTFLLARSEAAKRGQPVSICATTEGGGLSCTGGNNWNHGWLVFADPDANGAIAATSDVLRTYANDAKTSGLKITSATGGSGHFVLRPFNQAGTAGNLTICDDRGASEARTICIATNGRARLSEVACDGSTISCP